MYARISKSLNQKRSDFSIFQCAGVPEVEGWLACTVRDLYSAPWRRWSKQHRAYFSKITGYSSTSDRLNGGEVVVECWWSEGSGEKGRLISAFEKLEKMRVEYLLIKLKAFSVRKLNGVRLMTEVKWCFNRALFASNLLEINAMRDVLIPELRKQLRWKVSTVQSLFQPTPSTNS